MQIYAFYIFYDLIQFPCLLQMMFSRRLIKPFFPFLMIDWCLTSTLAVSQIYRGAFHNIEIYWVM